MTIARVREIVAEYRALLDLTDWDIRCRWSRRGELADADGQCRWQPEYRIADVVLRRQQPDSEIPHTVVHELLHLRLQGHTLNEAPYDPQLELGINRTAAAILQR